MRKQLPHRMNRDELVDEVYLLRKVILKMLVLSDDIREHSRNCFSYGLEKDAEKFNESLDAERNAAESLGRMADEALNGLTAVEQSAATDQLQPRSSASVGG